MIATIKVDISIVVDQGMFRCLSMGIIARFGSQVTQAISTSPSVNKNKRVAIILSPLRKQHLSVISESELLSIQQSQQHLVLVHLILKLQSHNDSYCNAFQLGGSGEGTS